jgi:hypothetical protein
MGIVSEDFEMKVIRYEGSWQTILTVLDFNAQSYPSECDLWLARKDSLFLSCSQKEFFSSYHTILMEMKEFVGEKYTMKAIL